MSPVTDGWLNEWEIISRRRRFFWRDFTPPQLFAGSFLLLIIMGTIGLRLLPGLYTGNGLGWLDAVFTATSAVCVTGLIVVDTATYFTTWGQAFLLLLIQLGGIGMITLTSLIILALGRRLSLRTETLSASHRDIASHVEFRQLTRDVVRFTLAAEAAGALALYIFWLPRFGFVDGMWHAIFQAVSAFCNAGFSTFSDSLIGFQTSPHTLLVFMILIVSGGIGFLTMEELYLRRKARREGRSFQLSLHTRIVIGTTVILLFGGWILFTAFEWDGALGLIPGWARPVNGLFMSVTARTAGFNTVDYATASDGSNFLTILFMSIGGSPGSTAGGMKTTTIALIGLLAWARLRGFRDTMVGFRTVPEETIQRAVGLFVAAFGVMTAAIFLLTAVEQSAAQSIAESRDFISYMFEAVSAFNTVGLSMGVTPDLTTFGKIQTIMLMYIGRIGPLVFAAAIAIRAVQRGRALRYAQEDVVVG